jgi:hypothetical protein
VVLPKRSIEILSHAHHRAVSRFGYSKSQATHVIREALRNGQWFQNPDDPHEFVVLEHVENQPICVVAQAETQQVTVKTLYPLRNRAKIRAYKQNGGEFTAQDIAQRYRLR